MKEHHLPAFINAYFSSFSYSVIGHVSSESLYNNPTNASREEHDIHYFRTHDWQEDASISREKTADLLHL